MTTSMKDGLVVSYRNSTSNHNSRYYKYFLFQLYLIEILHQTTTGKCIECRQKKLYLIEILHQTTTVLSDISLEDMLYLIEILHQTTTPRLHPSLFRRLYLIEILHQTTTWGCPRLYFSRCILSKFYIKPQPKATHKRARYCCILSKFYIKPQHLIQRTRLQQVVSYRNSTSNHNPVAPLDTRFTVVSYRNSTSNHNIRGGMSRAAGLYLIEILHQTTTTAGVVAHFSSCILSKFYIKPQRLAVESDSQAVVSYRNSTSNHNSRAYPNSLMSLYLIEILHQTTTPRITWIIKARLYLIEILHQTTTDVFCFQDRTRLYLIEILHQTTTRR